MKVKVDKKPRATLEVTVVVPQDKVKHAYDELFKTLVANAELKGFRKGQAPSELVKESMDVSKIYGDVINNLLQTYYPQALKENHILPVANPRVEIKEFDLEKDFEFVATVAVRPEIKIGDYKKEVKKIFEEKTKQMKELNAERIKAGEPVEHDHAHLSPDDVVEGIVNASKIEFADLVVEDETDRLMSRLVDQAQAIGMSLEQYLKAHNKSIEDLRADYSKVADRNLKAEFALSELVNTEKVEVDDEEVKAMVQAAGSAEGMAALDSVENKLYIRSILLKNKLITNIIKEIEGDPHTEDKSSKKAEKSQKQQGKKEEAKKEEK